MDKYKVYCETDGKWEEVVSSSEPTQCPIDPLHSIKLDSVSVVESGVTFLDGTPTQTTLDEYKKLKINKIDSRTQELISVGFSFGDPAKVFSLDSVDQTIWLALDHARLDLTYPFSISTLDDEVYLLPSAEAIHGLFQAAMGTAEYHYGTGRALKEQINNATTESEIDAVVDNR